MRACTCVCVVKKRERAILQISCHTEKLENRLCEMCSQVSIFISKLGYLHIPFNLINVHEKLLALLRDVVSITFLAR